MKNIELKFDDISMQMLEEIRSRAPVTNIAESLRYSVCVTAFLLKALSQGYSIQLKRGDDVKYVDFGSITK